ncbi:MAG: energy coupling factor transporter S component ThiW [Tissierellia bacterium]|nr:energy coupling factor transporter S component ThiW [Tissierellia bacterium]
MRENKKIVLTGLFVALGVTLSFVSFPVGVSRCYPVQHLLNLLSAVILGPVYGVSQAFLTSLIRNLMGTGSILAFPGSMFGALISAYGYAKTKKLSVAFVGEVAGTSILGGIVASLLARLFLAKEAMLFAFVIPFFISTFGGSVIGLVLLLILKKTKVLEMEFY